MIWKTTMKALVAPAALAAGLLAFAGQADAVVYTATYTGVVSNPQTYGTYAGFLDGTDVVTGAAFTAVFRWDDADADPLSEDSPPLYSIYSGPMTATLAIGSSTFSFASTPAGSATHVDGSGAGASTIVHYLDSGFPPGATYREAIVLFTNGGDDLLSSWDWRTPGTYDLTGTSTFGGFGFSELDPASTDSLGGASADLKASSLVIAREGDVSAAPEPAAWALMILGFGGAGAMLRRRAHPRRAHAAM